MFKKKKKGSQPTNNVIAICPHCKVENGLDRVRNYLCHNCNRSVLFFAKPNSDELHPNAKTFNCTECGALNFVGIKFCPKCKKENV